MKSFNKDYLPDEVRYKGKTYYMDLEETNKLRALVPFKTKNRIRVLVLSRQLRKKLDIHGKPYKPTEYIFSCD